MAISKKLFSCVLALALSIMMVPSASIAYAVEDTTGQPGNSENQQPADEGEGGGSGEIQPQSLTPTAFGENCAYTLDDDNNLVIMKYGSTSASFGMHDLENALGNTWTEITSFSVRAGDTISVSGDMASMFYDCKQLVSADLTGLDTSAVQSMEALFDECESLVSVNLKGLDTSRVTNMSEMFYKCEKLTSIDLEGLNTSAVTNMSAMFEWCKSLTSINLKGMNTSAVIDMTGMFHDCEALTSLDLSSFNTSNVTDMLEMFYTCPELETIYVSQEGFNVAKVSLDDDMFKDSEKLEGGAGTVYNSDHTDISGACIDTDVDGTWGVNKGYFTLAPTAKHTHAVSTDCSTTEGTQVEFEPLTSTGGNLVSGNYYLTRDVELTGSLDIDNGVEVNLCLNGHVLKGPENLSAIDIKAGGTLNLCDCGSATTHYFSTSSNPWVLDPAATGETDTVKAVAGGVVGCAHRGATNNGTFRMYGGNIVGNETLGAGGGVLNYGSLEMQGGSIQGNVAESDGGGVHNFGSFVMKGGSIQSNVAESDGAGIFNQGGTTTIEAGLISNNKTQPKSGTEGYGGGICIENGSVAMADGTISGNSGVYGAGVCIAAPTSSNASGVSEFTMTGGSIEKNTGQVYGGGVAIEGGALFTMTGGSITGNNITGATIGSNEVGYGGGVIAEGTMHLSGSAVISGNTAAIYGNNLINFSRSLDLQEVEPIILTDALADDASIGISTMETLLRQVPSTAIVSSTIPGKEHAITADDAAKFTNDDPRYSVFFNATEKSVYLNSTFTVIFNVQGHGTAPANQTIENGHAVAKPDDPTAAGYTFNGWYKDSDCTTEWNFDTEAITEPTTIYAKWTQLTCAYVSSTGSDSTGDGTYAKPYQTIAKAFEQVPNDGTIYIMDNIEMVEGVDLGSKQNITLATTDVNGDGTPYTGGRVTISKATSFPAGDVMFESGAAAQAGTLAFKDLVIDGKKSSCTSATGAAFLLAQGGAVLDNVLVQNFTLNSGALVSAQNSGFVELQNGTTITEVTAEDGSNLMQGGSGAQIVLADNSVLIANNTLYSTGSVFFLEEDSNAKILIRDAKIQGNTLENGYVLQCTNDATLGYCVSGNAYIYDNTDAAGERRNIFIANGSSYNTSTCLISVAGALGANARIGVFSQTAPSDTTDYAVIDIAKSYDGGITWGTDESAMPAHTLSYASGDWKHFVSDNPNQGFVRQGESTDAAKYVDHSARIVLAYGYRVTGGIINGSLAPLGVKSGADYEGFITPATGASYPVSIESVTVGESILSSGDYQYDLSTGKITIAASKITDDVRIVATCPLRIYGITLSDNGGTGGTGAIYEHYEVGWYSDSAATAAISKVAIPSKTGYEFAGYFDSATGTTKYIDSNGTILAANNSFAADTTIYAQWTIDTNKQVWLDGEPVSRATAVDQAIADPGKPHVITVLDPSMPGESDDIADLVAKIASPEAANTDISLQVPTAEGTVIFDKAAILAMDANKPAETTELHLLIQETTSEGASKEVVRVYTAAIVDQNGTVLAMRFGTGRASLTVAAPTTAKFVKVTCITETPEEALGSYPVAEDGNATFETSHFSDFKLEAMVDTVTITFDANGGTGTMDSVVVEKGDKYALPECGFTAPDGKQFKCWDISGQEYAVGQEIAITENAVVKAIWQDASSGGSSASDSDTLAETGDTANMMPWLLMLGLSAAALIGLSSYRKKSDPKGKHTH